MSMGKVEQLLDELAELDLAELAGTAAAARGGRSLMQAVYSEQAVRVRSGKRGHILELVALSDPWPVGIIGVRDNGWTLTIVVKADTQWLPAPELDLVVPVAINLLAEALTNHLVGRVSD